jgi:hypothetical protein
MEKQPICIFIKYIIYCKYYKNIKMQKLAQVLLCYKGNKAEEKNENSETDI